MARQPPSSSSSNVDRPKTPEKTNMASQQPSGSTGVDRPKTPEKTNVAVQPHSSGDATGLKTPETGNIISSHPQSTVSGGVGPKLPEEHMVPQSRLAAPQSSKAPNTSASPRAHGHWSDAHCSGTRQKTPEGDMDPTSPEGKPAKIKGSGEDHGLSTSWKRKKKKKKEKSQADQHKEETANVEDETVEEAMNNVWAELMKTTAGEVTRKTVHDLLADVTFADGSTAGPKDIDDALAHAAVNKSGEPALESILDFLCEVHNDDVEHLESQILRKRGHWVCPVFLKEQVYQVYDLICGNGDMSEVKFLHILDLIKRDPNLHVLQSDADRLFYMECTTGKNKGLHTITKKEYEHLLLMLADASRLDPRTLFIAVGSAVETLENDKKKQEEEHSKASMKACHAMHHVVDAVKLEHVAQQLKAHASDDL